MFHFSTRNSVRASRSGRRPPPNYFSRRVQLQVGVLVFLFMAVLMLMVEARKPENWAWLWKLDQRRELSEREPSLLLPGARDGAEASGPTIDTRVADRAVPTEAPPGEPVVSETKPPAPPDWSQASGDPLLDQAALHAWMSIWAQLTPPQRDLLREGLRRQRRGEPDSSAETDSWGALLAELDRRWEAYQLAAAATLTQTPYALTPDQLQQARDVLAALAIGWQTKRAALQAAGHAAPGSADQAAALDALQQILDRRAWQAVEDDTVLRAADREAWLRCWDQVDALATPQLSALAQPVTFVQLFSQPEAYRGRLVRVTGTARLGYRAVSRDPQATGRAYDILWLRPSDGSNSPIAVYARELPPGFPPLPARGTGRDGVELRDDVEVTGVFFKRWLYASRDGLRTAPLVLGRITRWTPAQQGPGMTRVRPTASRSALGLALAAAAVGLVLVMIVARRRRRAVRAEDPRAALARQLPEFDAGAVQPPVEDRLNQLASEERHEP